MQNKLLFFSFESLEEWLRACQKVNAGLEKQPMIGLVIICKFI